MGAGNTALGNIQGAATAGQGYVNTAAQNANNLLSNVNATEQGNLNPYTTVGANGTAALNPYLQLGQTGAAGLSAAQSPNGQFSFNPNTIASNPDYQFQLQQGTQAVQRAAAANGTLNSGGTAKAIDQFSQGLASNEIGQAYNQALSTYQTNLGANEAALGYGLTGTNTAVNAGLQGTGLSQAAYQNYGNVSGTNLTNAATQLAGIGINSAAQQTPVLEGIGNAKAGGSVAQGNIWGGFVNGVTNNAANALAALQT